MQVGLHDDDANVCALEDCTEVDPLSARCTHCKKVFCSRHITTRAHQCSEEYDAKVAACPVCGCVVGLEYPGQRVDEAVSLHLDRGCRNLRESTNSHDISHKGLPNSFQGAHRLGGRRPCGVVACADPRDIRVECDRCGHAFCLEHRNPSLHDCKGNLSPERRRVVSSTTKTVSESPGTSEGGATTIAKLLCMRAKPLSPTSVKAAATNANNATLLILFLIPLDEFNTSREETSIQVVGIPPFYVSISKNAVLGKVLDLAITEASKKHSNVIKSKSKEPWHVHAMKIPVPKGVVCPMYPSLPLSTKICKTILVDSPSLSSISQKEETILSTSISSSKTSTLVVISHFSTLPEELIKNLYLNKVIHGGFSDGCCNLF
ncbi:unnamed protein product [Phytomonas sp. Hart1]|nr:unnamed protein product [Phytomonas sp. Hart1]|eukprot:CCW69610.1 unnamed protein product [Phytomonas sp. isolate Hart1]